MYTRYVRRRWRGLNHVLAGETKKITTAGTFKNHPRVSGLALWVGVRVRVRFSVKFRLRST